MKMKLYITISIFLITGIIFLIFIFNTDEKKALRGNAEAQCNLGDLYFNGSNVPRDYIKAFEWFEKAALQGYPKAQFSLGVMYEINSNIPLDYKKAFEWYEKAALQGYAEAQFSLGVMYEVGHGVTQNKKKAFEWFEKAALQGCVEAQLSLGDLYCNGNEVVPPDNKKAFDFYEKAALQGYAEAQFNIGNLYYMGNGVPKDYKRAYEWFEKAFLQGNEKAQHSLGIMYYEGHGVPKDNIMAYAYLNIAASKDNIDSKELREKLGKEMAPAQVEKAQELSRDFYKKIEDNKLKPKKLNAVMNFNKLSNELKKRTCIANMAIIHNAVRMYYMENSMAGDNFNLTLKILIECNYLKTLPRCPNAEKIDNNEICYMIEDIPGKKIDIKCVNKDSNLAHGSYLKLTNQHTKPLESK